jgi:hypothetical protein
LKLEPFDVFGEVFEVGFDFGDRALIAVAFSKLEEFGGVGESARQAVESADDVVELGPLLAQFLRALRVVPDVRLLELTVYFFEAFALVVVLKDTPLKKPYGLRVL